MATKKLSISRIPSKVRDKFPFLKTISYHFLAETLNLNGHLFLNCTNKIEYVKLWNYLSKDGRWKKTLRQTESLLKEIAPLIGITQFLPLKGDERVQLKYLEKAYHSDLNYDDFKNSEILEEEIGDYDYVVRNSDGLCNPAFYRFVDLEGNSRVLNKDELNFLRMVYSLEYPSEELNTWNNYLYAVPIRIGNALKWGRSFYKTRECHSETIREV